MGSSCLVGFTQTSLSSSYGKQKILEIKSRNSSSEPLSVEALKRRIHQKDDVTQTTPEVKKKPTNKTIINNPQTVETRIQRFIRETIPVVDALKSEQKLITINAELSKEAVFNEIIQKLDNFFK